MTPAYRRTKLGAPNCHLYDFAFVVEWPATTSQNSGGAFGYRTSRQTAKAEALKLARLNAPLSPIVTVHHPDGRTEQLLPYAHGKGGGYWRFVD
jgi:hypothetical protein